MINRQTKKLNKTIMICKNCGLEKTTQYCNKCNSKTPTLFMKECLESIFLIDKSRSLMKSGEKISGKPKREVEQYVGNKNKDVISEFERIRNGNKTKVIHRLWRRYGDIFKKVHEHKK